MVLEPLWSRFGGGFSAECNSLPPTAISCFNPLGRTGYSIITLLYNDGPGYDPNLVDRYLGVTYTSPAGNVTTVMTFSRYPSKTKGINVIFQLQRSVTLKSKYDTDCLIVVWHMEGCRFECLLRLYGRRSGNLFNVFYIKKKRAKWEFILYYLISENRTYFFISENDFLISKNEFLISENDFLISKNKFDFFISENEFLISEIHFLISENKTYLFYIKKDFHFWISKNIFWYQKIFSDIKNSISDIKKSIFWYKKIDFLISKNIFWYQKIDFLT